MTSQTPLTQTLGVMPPGDPFHGTWRQERYLELPHLPMPWDLSPATWLGQPSLRVPLGLSTSNPQNSQLNPFFPPPPSDPLPLHLFPVSMMLLELCPDLLNSPCLWKLQGSLPPPHYTLKNSRAVLQFSPFVPWGHSRHGPDPTSLCGEYVFVKDSACLSFC